MNNPRLQGAVSRFASDKKVTGNFPDQYQIFINYLILKYVFFQVNEEYPFESLLDADLLENINFGKNSSMAVDGCFALFGKNIIHLDMEDDEQNEILNQIETGTLHIAVIQTKSGDFVPTDLSTLSACMNQLFKDQKEWQKFVSFRQKCNELLGRSPKVKLRFIVYYVSGNPIDKNLFANPTFEVRNNDLKQAMKSFLWISEEDLANVDYYDDTNIYSIYEKQSYFSQKISETISFEKITDEIDCGEFGKTRFGAVRFSELMKILYNKDTERSNELYVYNVRDSIKDSPINNQIENSIRTNSGKFLLLNNGITMIVDKQQRRGETGIYLENIRIVNGCQTSHAILNTCKNESAFDNSRVPVKIIETEKDEIMNDITFSSNNQNPVTTANKFAIQPKMFELEKVYKDFNLAYPNLPLESVLLERRQGQYNTQSVPYLDMLAQAKAFLAVWNRKPHFVTMYAEQSLDDYRRLMDTDINFINKSLIVGILWYNVYKNIPPLFENARFHIFAAIILLRLEQQFSFPSIFSASEPDFNLMSMTLDEKWLLQQNIDFPKEIGFVVRAISSLKERFPTTSTGRIHYRKYYPVDTLITIFNKYKELHDAI